MIERAGWPVNEHIEKSQEDVSAYGITLRAFAATRISAPPHLRTLRYAFEHSGLPVEVDMVEGQQSDEVLIIVGARQK